jgi:hypothetical protein
LRNSKIFEAGTQLSVQLEKTFTEKYVMDVSIDKPRGMPAALPCFLLGLFSNSGELAKVSQCY